MDYLYGIVKQLVLKFSLDRKRNIIQNKLKSTNSLNILRKKRREFLDYLIFN